MPREFLRTLLTPNVRAAEAHYYGRSYPDLGAASQPEPLTEDESQFVAERDSFYLATVGESGWPYVQHRGGPRGFLRALSPQQLAFADHGGNRQLISVGSLQQNPRVCLFLMDYPRRTRLKILGHAAVLDAREHPDLVAATAPTGGHATPPERVIRIDVHAFDWNCPKFITPRFTAEEFEAAVAPLRERIRQLEAQLTKGTA